MRGWSAVHSSWHGGASVEFIDEAGKGCVFASEGKGQRAPAFLVHRGGGFVHSISHALWLSRTSRITKNLGVCWGEAVAINSCPPKLRTNAGP
jgi:hypothetical protein